MLQVERAALTGLEVEWPRRVAAAHLTLESPWILIERDRQGAMALRQPGPATGLPPAPAVSRGLGKLPSAAYVHFEDRHRGAREDILQRQRAYLDLFAHAAPVLDVGCGRGEFLELCREAGIEARGIDLDAGMVAHCDFATQVTGQGEQGGVRPDMVVRLAGGKQIVVDAKVPFAAYLEAVEAADADVHAQKLGAHARQLRAHVDQLAGKAYWEAFEPTPEFVLGAYHQLW